MLMLLTAALLLLSRQGCQADWAVAFGTGDGGAWSNGWSSEQGSPDMAASEAISRCEQNLKPCKIIAHGANTCVAVAVAIGGNGYGEANSPSMGGAKSAAMVGCIRDNPAGCELKAYFCDSSGGFVEKEMALVEQQALDNALKQVDEYNARQAAGGAESVDPPNLYYTCRMSTDHRESHSQFLSDEDTEPVAQDYGVTLDLTNRTLNNLPAQFDSSSVYATSGRPFVQNDGDRAPAAHTYLFDRNSAAITVEYYSRAATHTHSGTCQLDQ
jgi:hypothetical protein